MRLLFEWNGDNLGQSTELRSRLHRKRGQGLRHCGHHGVGKGQVSAVETIGSPSLPPLPSQPPLLGPTTKLLTETVQTRPSASEWLNANAYFVEHREILGELILSEKTEAKAALPRFTSEHSAPGAHWQSDIARPRRDPPPATQGTVCSPPIKPLLPQITQSVPCQRTHRSLLRKLPKSALWPHVPVESV